MALQTNGAEASVPWATLQEVHDWYAGRFVRLFNHGNELIPKVYLLEVNEDGTVGRNVPVPEKIVATCFESDDPTDNLGAVIEAFLDPSSETTEKMEKTFGFAPVIAVLVAEGMYLGPDLSRKARGAKKGLGAEPYPAILVKLYTATGSVQVAHRIHNLPRRRCSRTRFPAPPAEHTGQ